MIHKSLKILYFIFVISFFYFVIFTYFSKNNESKIYSKINKIENKSEINISQLPRIKNDTNNIINYNSEQIEDKKIIKRKIWELLK
tara:strand:- start:518 stop:775 length:258 start_codon:yes stop_codon:yes gene_type:complete